MRIIDVNFDFLKDGLVVPKPVGRGRKKKTPRLPIWEKYLIISIKTIENSIQEWDGYIKKPESRAEKYYASKNWTILNREQFSKGQLAEVSCSMTVGRITKFKIIPRYLWEGKGAQKTLVVDHANRVGTVTQQQHNVMATLEHFQQILLGLTKESEGGRVFWDQAKAIAKPKSKKDWFYDDTLDLWVERNKF
tara:strand:- start:509 stop:1084 length:576 start_codon:yes stop_codon:yes gene_type:complete